MLDEISNLAINLNIKIQEKKIINVKKISTSTLIGKGVLDEIKDKINTFKINLLICNCSLTPAQQKNLENYLKIKVTDRVGIIIEIILQKELFQMKVNYRLN